MGHPPVAGFGAEAYLVGMSVLLLVVILLLLAGLWWLANIKFPAITPVIKFLINCVIIGSAILLVLVETGLWDALKSVKVPRL